MDRNKDIDAKIRESFEAAEHKAPDGLWAAMDQKLDSDALNLDKQVKHSFEAIEENAPDAIWAGINRQLTIDTAWKGINAYLNRRLFYLWSTRIAALLLLSFGIGYWVWNQAPKQEETRFETAPVDKGQISTAPKLAPLTSVDATSAEKTSIPKTTAPQKTVNEKQSTLKAAVELPKQAANAPQGKLSLVDSIPNLKEADWRLETKSWQLFDRQALNHRLRKPLFTAISRRKAQRKTTFKHWELGLLYSYNRDFLSNSIYRESLDPRSLIASSAVYSHNVSLDLKYRFNPRWLLRFQWQPSRDLHLRYNTYAEGQYIGKELQLNFSQYGLGFEHHLPMAIGRQRFNMVLGAQATYGQFNRAQNFSGRIDERYQDAYGLQFNLGQDWHSGPLVLSYGLRTDFNFNNLYRGHGAIPAAFDRTWYRSWGLYIGSYYRF